MVNKYSGEKIIKSEKYLKMDSIKIKNCINNEFVKHKSCKDKMCQCKNGERIFMENEYKKGYFYDV